MFDFPSNPAYGTAVTLPDGSFRVWDSQKWRAAPSGDTVLRDMADVANVLDYGADPTQVADSTLAFQNALATGRNVYVPQGRYQLRKQLTVGNTNNAQALYGAGEQSQIWIGDNFDPAVTDGVFVLQGRETASAGMHDLYIGFIQPNDLASRATMKTLAAGGTSHLGGTGVQYPPAVQFGLANRFRLERLKITNAWDGFVQGNSPNASGGWYMVDIKMGAFHVGLQCGKNIDFSHITRWHNGPFDCWPGQSNIMLDGNTYAWQLGVGDRTEGITALDVAVFSGRLQFNNNGSWSLITNLQMDSDNSTIEHNDSAWTEISNVYFTCNASGPSNGMPSITMANGKLMVKSIAGWPGGQQPFLSQGGGWFTLIGGNVVLPTVNARFLSLTLGICNISGVQIEPTAGSWTVAPVQCSGGTLSFCNNVVSGGYVPAAAGFLHITTDSAAHAVVGNSWPAGSFTPPGALGTYNNASSLPLAGGTINGQITLAGPGTGLTFSQPAGTTRGALFATSGSLRWDLICDGDGESGSNNGSNFQLDAYSDTAALLSTPIKVWRTNGVVELAHLQVDGLVIGNLHVSGGTVAFGGAAASATDLSKHIDLSNNGANGFNYQGGNVNLVCASAFNFQIGGANIGFFNSTGINYVPIGQVGSVAGAFSVLALNSPTGPTIRAGAGAATGTQPKGSLWLRTDGAAGSTLYVTQGGGTWAAVAGV